MKNIPNQIQHILIKDNTELYFLLQNNRNLKKKSTAAIRSFEEYLPRNYLESAFNR